MRILWIGLGIVIFFLDIQAASILTYIPLKIALIIFGILVAFCTLVNIIEFVADKYDN